MDKGLGSVTWWGFSPAIDLVEYYKLQKYDKRHEELHILLIGAGDIRHIVKTLAQMHRHGKSKLHFYVLENNLEIYARCLLLTGLVLEKSERMGLQEKTELFLEIFGNTLLRSQAAGYVETMANDFVQMVTDFDYLAQKLPLFDLDQLKYKERDMLEGIFKMWRNKDKAVFDVEKCWDLRLRSHLGSRFDAAKGVFDWDFNMKLCDRGGEIIGNRLYKSWRQTGVAFTLREANYDVPNKTLCSGKVFKVSGERTARRGYWGDIVASPYIAFGIDCDEQSLYKKANKEYIKTAEDISQHNVMSLLYELQNSERYAMPQEGSGDAKSMSTISEEDEEAETNPPHDYECIPCPDIKITLLPLNSVPSIAQKAKYQKLFTMVYLSNSMVHLLKPDVVDLFADEATLILETAKFMTELNKEQYTEFTKRIQQMATNVGCTPLIDCDEEKDCFAFYQYKRS